MGVDGDETDLRRTSGELEELEDRQSGKEPVDCLFEILFADTSTPSLVQ